VAATYVRFRTFRSIHVNERGRKGARAKGVQLGSPKPSAKVETRIRELAAQAMGKVRIARTLGVGLTQRVLLSAGADS
jgi:hypothetical protein